MRKTTARAGRILMVAPAVEGIDPQKSGRVLMDHVMKLVTTALQWSYAKAEDDVSPEHLEAAAEQLTLRRDKVHVIDAKKEDESEKQESPEELEESKPKGKKEEKRGRKKRVSEEPEHPNPK